MKKTSTSFKLVTVILVLCFLFATVSACVGSAESTGFPADDVETAKKEPPNEPAVIDSLPSGDRQTRKTPLAAVALASAGEMKPDELYLHVGSPIALSDGKILPLDKDDPGVAAMLYMGRTLVPLRFISEFFGAEVSYDEATKSGVVKTRTHSALFPVGESYFTLDGRRIELDTMTILSGERIMLPLRALCEQVLGLSVGYSNGVIQIAEDTTLTSGIESEVKAKIGMYVKTADMDAFRRYIDEFGNNWDYPYYDVFDDVDVDFAMEADMPANAPDGAMGGASASEPRGELAPVPSAAPQPGADMGVNDSVSMESEKMASAEEAGNTGAGGSDHSSTNTQVEGVDEADIIKTDGRYIYLLGHSSIRIVDTSSADKTSGEMAAAAKISLPNDNLIDMYIDAGRIIVIGSHWNDAITYADTPDVGFGKPGGAGFRQPNRGAETTFVKIYDTTNMTDIKLLRGFEIEGNVVTTRKQNGYLYLLTSLYHRYGDIDPRPFVGEDDKIAPMPIECILIAPGCYTDSFLTLSAINIFDAEEEASSETIATYGYASTQYMSNNAIYIASNDHYYNAVNISKFTIAGGKVGYAGSGAVAGSLNDQFSMDEYRGFLRVATTQWYEGNKNNLFVLDGNMQVCGSVLGFAPNERIYSARFMGDRGYIVTFRQMDPLFVFDLSDPANPKITGELKVPGFSSYLHPVSENVILGVGNDVQDIYTKGRDGKETVIGQRTGGVKLSLFDVSDMGKPKEIDTLVLGDGGYAELLYNHKAAMFKADESMMAFCVDIYDDTKGGESFSGAVVISYADNSLAERGRITSAQWMDGGMGIYYGNSNDFYGQRLVYIGNLLYYAENGVIRSFDINTLTPKQSLRLW